MEVSYLFAGIGMIILIGFLGTLLFERTKIPDILILIFIGLIIGPLLSTYTSIGVLNDPQVEETLTTIAPYFAALALVIILFDGGLHLHLEKTMKKLGLAIIHTGIGFIGSMVVTALVCFYVLNMDFVVGLLLGAIIGGTSGAVIIPLMLRSCAKEGTRILLTLESVLTDVFCIVTALIFIEMMRGSTLDTGAMIQRLLSSFVLAGFIAFLFGVFWLMVLKKMEGKPFAFMVTIAALLVLYAVAEFIQVSGAIAALIFGLVLSNKDEIARILKFKGSFVLDEHIMQFHSEVSFLVRTFFFVYLGMTFTFAINPESFNGIAEFVPGWISWSPLLIFIFLLSIIFGGILLVRYISASVTCFIHKELKEDKSYMATMMGRGLAAAVLATLPFTIPAFFETTLVNGIETPSAYNVMMAPYQELYLNIAFMIIVLSVIVTSISVFVIERKRATDGTCMPEEAGSGDWTLKSPTYRKALEENASVPAPKPKPAGKEAPKPWVDPHAHHAPAKEPPRKTAPVQQAKPHILPRKAAPSQPVRQHPPAAKQAPVQAQPIKHTQTPKPETKSPPPKKHIPPPKDHPLVKRAAESEKKPAPVKKGKK
ncbi:MAG: cation:proton antiporter [Thermoplasmata archaeon]